MQPMPFLNPLIRCPEKPEHEAFLQSNEIVLGDKKV